jgi:TPR repeat protein
MIISGCGRAQTAITETPKAPESAAVAPVADETTPTDPGKGPIQRFTLRIVQILSPGRALVSDRESGKTYLLRGIPTSLVDDDNWTGWAYEGDHFQYTNVQGVVATVRTYITATNLPPQSKASILTAASNGDAEAQFNIAGLYFRGDTVRQDIDEALKWYRLSAAQGFAGSENDLGYIFGTGRGVPVNPSESFSWYKKAAEHGLAAAQCNLGTLYSQGLGVPQNYALAAEWFSKAAKQGNATALHHLGYLYESGLGVQIDFTQAWSFYSAAASKGNAESKTAIEGLPKKLNAYLDTSIAQIRQFVAKATDFQLGFVHTREEELAVRYTPLTRMGPIHLGGRSLSART